MMSPMVPRRPGPGPLPPLDVPRGAQIAAVRLASASASASSAGPRSPSSSGYPYSRPSPPASQSVSRTGSAGTSSTFDQQMNLVASSDRAAFDMLARESRSTSASSHRSGFANASPAGGRLGTSGSGSGDLGGVGDLFSTIVNGAPQDSSPQSEIVVKAMLPIVRKAMLSTNKAVFQVSLDSMRRIERMFGQEVIDQQIETLVETLEKQCGTSGGDARAARIFETFTALCSQEMASTLKQRFPQYDQKANVIRN